MSFVSHNWLPSFVLWPLPNSSTFSFIAIFSVSPLVYLLFLCSWNFLLIQLFLFSPFYTFSHFFLVPFGCSSSSFLIYFQSYSSIKTIVTLYWKNKLFAPSSIILSSGQEVLTSFQFVDCVNHLSTSSLIILSCSHTMYSKYWCSLVILDLSIVISYADWSLYSLDILIDFNWSSQFSFNPIICGQFWPIAHKVFIISIIYSPSLV